MEQYDTPTNWNSFRRSSDVIFSIYTRGSYSSRRRPYSVGPGTFTSRISLTGDEEYTYHQSHSRPSSQILDGDESDMRTDSIFSRSSYSPSNLSASNSSINERILSSRDGAHFETASNASEHLRNSNSDIRDQMRGVDVRSGGHGDTAQPTVRLRTKKARDRGLPTERPRSWHASKHPDPAYLSEEATMRSPGGGYLAGPTAAPRYYQQPHVAPGRRSKGWCESGDLKSTYRPEVNGSRDSVISGDSHRSYRSGRLSVSSSRSSGTMSSSRGSLENLLDSPASRPNLENQPQPVVLTSKYKQPPSSHHLQSGIVSQKMNIFERLSHESTSNIDSNKESREDSDWIHRLHQTPDDVEKEKRNRDNTKSPRQQSHFSFSPPTVSKFSGKPLVHKKSREEVVTKPDNNQKMRVSPNVSSGITYSDAKIVKTTSFDPYRSSQQAVPEPPQRDKSSAMAVRSHIRPGSQNENHRRTSTSPPSAYNRSPPAKPMHHRSASSSYLEPTHRITVTRPIEKTVEGNPARQERMFGVMSYGTAGNIVATSVTVSPKVSIEKESRKPSLPDRPDTVSRYENVKDFARVGDDARKMASDYLSRAELKVGENAKSTPDHNKSHSDDTTEAKSKGKYGSVWKTPQNQYSRARSANFSSVLQDWTDRESENTKAVSNTDKEMEMNYLNKKLSNTSLLPNLTSENAVSPTENAPSVLRSLQNTQHSERRSKNQDEKADNYEKLWLAESNPGAKAESKFDPSSDHKDWKYKEIDVEEPADDTSSPSNRYVDDIKEMSRKVLRETSFKRKDLDVSPSVQSFAQKQKAFQQPHPEQIDSPASFHARSRSYGNELEEESKSVHVEKGRKSQVGKPRPKSAGVFRTRTDRPVPAARNIVAPCQRPKIDHRKSDSLPDDGATSFGFDDQSRLSNSSKSSQNRRISIDVKPNSSLASGGRTNGMKNNRRSEVIDFFNRKTAKNDSFTPAHYTSMINITTANYDETNEKHKYDRDRISFSSKERNQKLRSPPGPIDGNRVQHLIENETPKSHLSKPEHGSVRKLKNFKETREKFSKVFDAPLSRAKSTSSLLDDESPKSTALNQSSFAVKSGDRSASLENLLNCGTDESTAPPSNGTRAHDEYPHLHVRDHRSKSSPLITSLPTKGELAVVPPPRKHAKNHRQRISNSSSTSSATTISTMSSFSSASSASIGIFPAVGEESERSSKLTSAPLETSQSPIAVVSGSELSSQPLSESRSSSRIPIDSNTYRVPKRKSTGKSPLKSRQSFENLPKSEDDKNTEKFPTPPESVINEPPQGGDASAKDLSYSKSLLAPPPTPPPLERAAEKLLEELVEKRKSHNLPPPPSVPSKPISVSREEIPEEVQAQPMPSEQRKSSVHDKSHSTGRTDLPKRGSSGYKYENVHVKDSNQQYENVFSPDRKRSIPTATAEEISPKSDQSAPSNSDVTEEKETPTPTSRPSITISSEPLLPDVSFLPESVSAATLEEEHPDLTRDIIKGDKALAQVLTTSSKKAIDYMAGVFSQPSHHIVEEGMKYRRRKPGTQTNENPTETQFESLLPNDITGRDNLPASSTYYKTSASKAKILHLMKEKLADGEIPDEEQESLDEINRKKVELVLSIRKKLDDLHSMRGLLEVEMKENECLGKQVFNLTKSVCTPKEQDKYNTLVQEVDKIINLLLGLSGRLARVENTIQMLPPDADKQEMEILCEKRKKLTEQHNDAKQLKESIDKRQKTVSEILASYLDQEQFADYEHYIKMKSALIMEQRELDDKTKLGQEQMQCLRDSLPEDWQNNLDKLLEE